MKSQQIAKCCCHYHRPHSINTLERAVHGVSLDHISQTGLWQQQIKKMNGIKKQLKSITKNQQHSDKHDIILVYSYPNLHARSRFLSSVPSRSSGFPFASRYMRRWGSFSRTSQSLRIHSSTSCTKNVIHISRTNDEYVNHSIYIDVILDHHRFSSDLQQSCSRHSNCTEIKFIYLFGVDWECVCAHVCVLSH